MHKNAGWNQIEASEDLLSDILSRLPAKKLMKLKFVSKLWHKVITSPHFAHLQLRNCKEKPVYLLCTYATKTMRSYLKDRNMESHKTYECPYYENPSTRWMICSFDGLIASINDSLDPRLPDWDIRVHNLATRRIFVLPRGSPSLDHPLVGFGFGPRINDYKVFRFFVTENGSQAEHCECEVYSSSTGLWKGIGSVAHMPMQYTILPRLCSVFVDKKTFWFVASEENYRIPGSVLVVDMEENFRTIDLPMKATVASFLVNLEGCLSLVIFDEEYDFHVWVLRDCNEPEWVSKCSDKYPYSTPEVIHCITATESELFIVASSGYHIYNPQSRTWNEFYLDDDYDHIDDYDYDDELFPFVFIHKQSLLSCRGYRENNGQRT